VAPDAQTAVLPAADLANIVAEDYTIPDGIPIGQCEVPGARATARLEGVAFGVTDRPAVALLDATLLDATPLDTAPLETTRQDATPLDATPLDTAPQDTTPHDTTALDATPLDNALLDTTVRTR
jgi:hypothetical protein